MHVLVSMVSHTHCTGCSIFSYVECQTERLKASARKGNSKLVYLHFPDNIHPFNDLPKDNMFSIKPVNKGKQYFQTCACTHTHTQPRYQCLWRFNIICKEVFFNFSYHLSIKWLVWWLKEEDFCNYLKITTFTHWSKYNVPVHVCDQSSN